MSSMAQKLMRVTGIGANSVTLTNTADAQRSETRPLNLGFTQVVITTSAATPPLEFWGTVAIGGEFLVSFERVNK